MLLKKYLKAFASLFFAHLCYACNDVLRDGEVGICTTCHSDLPYTDFHMYGHNPVAKQFWGRVVIANATAMLYFVKGGRVQHLIHNLKYNKKPEVGYLLGKLLGLRLQSWYLDSATTVITPVPLHPGRQRRRGYNQSEMIATGLAEVLDMKIISDSLVRGKKTATQTKRSRFSRFENMLEVFHVQNIASIAGMDVLLVDDVTTTGATLEACSTKLLEAGASSIHIAVVAFSE